MGSLFDLILRPQKKSCLQHSAALSYWQKGLQATYSTGSDSLLWTCWLGHCQIHDLRMNSLYHCHLVVTHHDISNGVEMDRCTYTVMFT